MLISLDDNETDKRAGKTCRHNVAGKRTCFFLQGRPKKRRSMTRRTEFQIASVETVRLEPFEVFRRRPWTQSLCTNGQRRPTGSKPKGRNTFLRAPRVGREKIDRPSKILRVPRRIFYFFYEYGHWALCRPHCEQTERNTLSKILSISNITVHESISNFRSIFCRLFSVWPLFEKFRRCPPNSMKLYDFFEPSPIK